MTTETILTGQQISDAWGSTVEEWGLTLQQFEQVLQFARAIEQAVLQSEQVQAWKRDSEKLRSLEPKLDRFDVFDDSAEIASELFVMYQSMSGRNRYWLSEAVATIRGQHELLADLRTTMLGEPPCET